MGQAKRRKELGTYPAVESKPMKPTRLRTIQQTIDRGNTNADHRQLAKFASRR